ncbi:Alpha-N-arabinofuranosidase [Xylanimonas cellulosilytica DSM 15894]|uniref:non-reducing end alpha-L-arabinofuranosidase n=1 Tax=Xylanimonas cellulosilytica (strain DSM 15894 / JCM 12276 / CECT 5975 / KCTC 9989 / LMG 20990 / NBRC 107835 / XIL07) TaxID=446471 RepID=D1BVI0_XYLCX|nr:alpha-N-arabinofuranosidase [Xylanimonas cellulosilytica]ACZ29451.1 Alpha-N-arabinofuranosidase [Xylanimonas cellulosilytica DSM 15894]
MLPVSITLDPAFRVGPVRRRTFGSFVEHLGRCVYTGIHDPEHPTADADGFRKDVVELTRDLGVSTVRYPGGNFVSGYRWEDGIGPVEQRPRRLDLAWHSTDPNTVGVDEFVRWSRAADVEPMMAVNLGTRGVQEALDLLEYCNVKGGTRWSDLRRQNGSPEPHDIRMWCLGNEMDGPWQIGHKTAYEYGRLATETARAMRMIQPDLELVACGSSGVPMPTFGEWERIVLGETYEYVDMISAHAYYWEEDGDLGSFLASATDMDHFIESVAATADAVRAHKKVSKRIHISFDEWNVWYQHRAESKPPTGDDWPVAPVLLEDRYNVADAVVVGNLLISLLRHTDRVHAASLAQLVNVIAPIMTEPGGRAWKQTIFHPFAQASRYARGDVLRVALDVATYETAKFGDVALADAVATYDAETGEVALFAVNRSTTQPARLDVDLRSIPGLELVEASVLANPDHQWQATADDDSSVAPRANATAQVADGRLTLEVPPVSWNVVRLAVRG